MKRINQNQGSEKKGFLNNRSYAVQLMMIQNARTRVRLVILAVVALSVLAGCAPGARVKSKAVSQESSMTTGPSVERLQDDRAGFVITETPSMDAESRSDFKRAIAMMKARDYDGAISLLEKVIERSPGVTAPYINIAIACRHLDKPEQAEQHLKAALNLVPEHPVASNEYGLLLRRAGRFAEARAIYEKTLTTFPDYYPVRRNLGILCDLYLNDLTCALEQYEIYSEAKPQDDQVRIWVADLRMRLGR